MAIEIRDPATGKIKPVYIIAGVSLGGLILFLLLGRGSSSSGVTSGGQSGENTNALAGLQDAIGNLAGGGGGGGGSSSSAGTTSGSVGGGDSGGGGISSAPSSGNSSYTQDVPLGNSNVASTVGNPYSARISVPGGETMTPINTYPAAANTPQAVTKPSNSGLSSAPVVYTPVSTPIITPVASIARTPGAVLPVSSGGGPRSIAYRPGGTATTPIITPVASIARTPGAVLPVSSGSGPRSIAYRPGGTATTPIITPVQSVARIPRSAIL